MARIFPVCSRPLHLFLFPEQSVRELELLLALLAASATVQMLARRLGVPYPSLLVIGGLAIALIPGLPRIDSNPELLFLLFVPPLLYWTALTTSVRELRDVIGPVARLSTILVLLTMTVVAVVIHFLNSEFSWASAFLLGAIARSARSSRRDGGDRAAWRLSQDHYRT